jgi:hypothetical protein
VVEDDQPLPAKADLVTFSHTISSVSIKAVSVITHQLVATQAAAAGEGEAVL